MKDRPSGWIDKEHLIPTALYFRQIPPSEVKHVRHWLSTPSLREKLVFAYGDKNIAKLDVIVESIIAKDKQVIKWHVDELEKAIGSKFEWRVYDTYRGLARIIYIPDEIYKKHQDTIDDIMDRFFKSGIEYSTNIGFGSMEFICSPEVDVTDIYV